MHGVVYTISGNDFAGFCKGFEREVGAVREVVHGFRVGGGEERGAGGRGGEGLEGRGGVRELGEVGGGLRGWSGAGHFFKVKVDEGGGYWRLRRVGPGSRSRDGFYAWETEGYTG